MADVVYYRAEQVDPVMKKLGSLLASTVEFARDTMAELTSLKAAQKEPKVVLQKVANAEVKCPDCGAALSQDKAGALICLKHAATAPAKFAFDQKVMTETLDFLEANAALDPDHRAETILRLNEDPNFALKLAARVLHISAPAHQEGRGFRKSASMEDKPQKPHPDDLAALKAAEDAAWMDVATLGA